MGLRVKYASISRGANRIGILTIKRATICHQGMSLSAQQIFKKLISFRAYGMPCLLLTWSIPTLAKTKGK
jgi:hypothetical protein